MAKRFIDLYNEAQQKKQAGAQKASLPAAPAQKKAQTTQKASLSQLSMPGSIGQTYRDELPKLEMPKLKTVRTTAPQIKKSYAPKADNLTNIRALGAGDYTGSAKLMEKAAQTIKSGLLGSASGFAEVVGQATPTTGDQHMGQFSGFGDLGRAVRESRETGADISESVRRTEQERSAKRKASQQRIYDTATELAEKSAELREQAKQGAGKVGSFLVDLGVTGTQVAGDALANALLPGSGMAMMATRVYGQSAGDARREGKTEGQQLAAGLKGAAIETLTEKLFGGLAKAYGAGTAEEVVEKIADKLTRSDAGKRAATWLINSGGEGVEEVLSDILNPIADRALGLDDGEGRILTADDAAQMGYDFLLGAAMGALGGAGQLRAAKSAPAVQETQPVQMPTLERTSDGNTAKIPQLATKPTARNAQPAKGANFDAGMQNAADGLTEANAAVELHYTEIPADNTAEQGGASDAAYARAVNSGKTVRIPNSILEKYQRINADPLTKLKNVVKEFYESHLKGQAVDVELNNGVLTVMFENDGKKKSVGWRMKPEKAASFEQLLALTRNSEYAYTSANRDAGEAASVPRFHYYMADAEIGGEHIPVKIQVRDVTTARGKQETHYYYHNLQRNRETDSPGAGAESTNSDGNAYGFSAETTVPQDAADVNTLGSTEYTPLRMPMLDAEGNVLYKKAEGTDAASDRPTKTPQDTIADIEPSIDSIAQTEGAVNEVKMPVISENAPADRKAAQFDIIQQSNPFDAELGGHTWIKSADDILTYQEAIDSFGGVEDVTPDFRAADVQAALDSGEVTVYSSYPIEQGTFVTPSRMEAQSYAGDGAQVYSRRVPLSDVAWIDEVQGQYTGPAGENAGGVEMPVIGENAPAETDAYMDALAQDENIFTDDPYTPADAVYDAQLRRLQESEAPPAAEREQVLQADLDELASLYADQADVIGRREYLQDATSDMVTSKTAPKKQSGREAAREAWDFFYRKMVDAGHSVTKLSEAVNDPYLYQFYNQARASSSAGVNMITDAQTDVRGRKVGDSLNDVFSPIRARGDDLYHDFQLYMFDLHNIDRMSLSKGRAEKVLEATAALRDFDAENPGLRTDTAAQLHRLTEDHDPDIAALARERERLLRNLDKAEAIQDKPVFDYEFSAEDSRARAEKLLAQHPEFAEYQARVRKYIDNMMQYRVDSGLMTQENADFLKEFYPNYVPTMRVQDKDAAGRGRDLNAVRIGKTVGRAQGGTERLVPLHEALGKQTMKVVREGSKNRFADRLLRDYLRTDDTDAVNRYVREASQYEHEFAPETLDDAAIERPSKDKIVTAYMDGRLWEITVDDTLFDAVKALSPDAAESNKLTRVARGANNLFKSLVTGYNPTFLARNVIRDLQTAGLNTRDAAAFARNYPRALAEIKNNGEYWRLYKALGGVYSSVFDYSTGTVKEPKGRMGKVMARVEALNVAAEQAPRLAEFMGVMQKAETAKQRGETVSDLAAEADALYAAADITVNFGRSGSLGKVLNANYVPFLNPGVQGLDKLVRRVTETKGAKEWAKLAARAAALGIAPSLLNALLYHDDDEWDDLRDSDKDTNYMFKLGNGYWLKIPKGRELSLLGITADRVADAVKGEDVDILSTINTMGNQVAPANPLTSNIFSALIDSQLLDPDSPGRTWYGGDIESQRLQNYAPGERYDSSTDVFSKAVGKALGISPKKLNYVLDQYSGVLGDFLLPVLTPQAERGMFEKAFTVDAMSSNRVSGDFYDEANKLKYAKNDGDVASGVVSRWWNKQQTACSDLWKQIREVEASEDLSDSEKKRQTRELKAIVTGIQKNAIAQEDAFREAVEIHLEAGADEDTAYREANKDCFGAEYALQAYNKDVYERAQDARRNGVSYDDFYTYYFGTKDIKATSTESAVSQKFDYLRRSGIGEDAQAEIYFADMASDKTLLTQAELEMSAGITPAQYYSYKAATSSMSKKAEKLEAITAMDLTSEQKDALYYSEGWAESKIYEAPWRSDGYVGVSMPVLGSSGVTMPVLESRGNTGVQMPVLGGDTVKMPVLGEKSAQRIKMPVLG